MYHQIRISDEVLRRLKAMAEPYLDREPGDTIRRLLDLVESTDNAVEPRSARKDSRDTKALLGQDPARRGSRERGAEVDIGGRRLQAISVRDLYDQALRVLVDEHAEGLASIQPFSTSGQRYLLARNPRHPTGKDFVIPVGYDGYYMEAHKDYRNAVRHLQKLADRLGVPMVYLGG